ncbi:hypothetical protein X566_21110 [Afipia sp. P52-10]|nr:hypothetical protein X566_21110 [Afipia sp. P52-10]
MQTDRQHAQATQMLVEIASCELRQAPLQLL